MSTNREGTEWPYDMNVRKKYLMAFECVHCGFMTKDYPDNEQVQLAYKEIRAHEEICLRKPKENCIV